MNTEVELESRHRIGECGARCLPAGPALAGLRQDPVRGQKDKTPQCYLLDKNRNQEENQTLEQSP